MRIGFFGAPKIAAYCMERLLLAHEVVFAIKGFMASWIQVMVDGKIVVWANYRSTIQQI